MIVTREYLLEHPDHIFVFGDNLRHSGCKGAAELRYIPNTYPFITQKFTNYAYTSYYTPEEYASVFYEERFKLLTKIKANPDKTFLISRLGAGLANKYLIWEKVIRPGLLRFGKISNVELLWEEDEKEGS